MNALISKVLEYKGHDVEAVSPRTSVLRAVQRMNERRIGALLVTDRDVPVGILTRRDILVRVIACGADPESTPVGEVMTRNPVSVRSDATVGEAMRVITHHRCHHVPVVDGRELLGMVSIGDLTSWLVHDQQRTIADLENYVRRA